MKFPKRPERVYGCYTGVHVEGGYRCAFLCEKTGLCRYCLAMYTDIRRFKTWAEAEADQGPLKGLALVNSVKTGLTESSPRPETGTGNT